ncbi:MAG: ROK family protein [Parasporobacterium sp.]|nr:ROK family protein [Parasporobacterium sp.]
MRYRFGVDIGGTSVKAGVVDENYRILSRGSVRTPDTFEKSMKAVADLLFDLAGQMGLSESDFSCAGFGVPCSVIPGTGRLVFANNTNWKNVSIKNELSKYLSIPLYFGNDANCAVIGETLAGAARGKKHVVMITLGTGVGGGIIIDGKMFAGGDGLGAEIGHMPIVYNGIRCTCGLSGCFECYASATALIRQTKEAMAAHPESALNAWAKEHGEVNGQTAFDCAKEKDPAAMEVIDQYTSYIATGLGGLVNIFRPELFIIGGGVSNAGDALLDPVRAKLSSYTLAYDVVGSAPVQKAILGNDAGMIGAAYLDQMN